MGASFRNCSGGTHWAINLCAPRIAAGSASRNWRRRLRSHLHQNTASLPLMFEFLRCRRPFPVAHLWHILAIFGHIEPMERRRRSSFNEIIEEGSAYLAANPKSIQDYEEDNDVEECEYSPGPDEVVVLVASFASLSSRHGQLPKASPETLCTDFGFAESDIPNHPPDHGNTQPNQGRPESDLGDVAPLPHADDNGHLPADHSGRSPEDDRFGSRRSTKTQQRRGKTE
jgi:hypothetical protein